MKTAEFHPAAELEAHYAAASYETIRAGLGDEFRTELSNGLLRIEKNPQMYALEEGLVRIAPLTRFPYALIYQDDADTIRVVAVAHHRRRPGYWSERTS